MVPATVASPPPVAGPPPPQLRSGAMPRVQLREVCGVRSGDKGDRSDLTLFMDDGAAYEAVCAAVSTEAVAEHFGSLVLGPIDRYEGPQPAGARSSSSTTRWAEVAPGRCGRTTWARPSGVHCCAWRSDLPAGVVAASSRAEPAALRSTARPSVAGSGVELVQ